MYTSKKENKPKNKVYMSQNTIQRKVGMEFEMAGNKENVIVKKEDNTFDKCGHDVLIKDYIDNGFKITGDMGNLEFVTYAFDERTPEGIAALMDACQGAANAFNNMNTWINNTDTHEFDGKVYSNVIINDVSTPFYVCKGATKVAHPQATVGVKFKNLDSFIDKYSKVSVNNNIEFDINNINNIDKLYLPIGGSLSAHKKIQKEMIKSEEVKNTTPPQYTYESKYE